MGLRSAIRGWFGESEEIDEAAKALTPSQLPERAGYSYGIPRGGLNEWNAGIGEATQTDRRSQLQQLYESYLSCPWAWACVNAIARTITAGGMVMDWNADTGEGDQAAPEKPEAVLAVERLLSYTNDRQNIRQLMRNVVVDLLVFGDAFIEVTWWTDVPVALYNLDVPTTTPIADEHGKITGYKQTTEFGQTVSFEPRDVIHISLDAPRSGVFGVSPTQAAILPITAWLFAAACGKEMARKGLPPNIHADFPGGTQQPEMNRWRAQYQAQNVGPRNIGVPVMTRGGAHIAELQAGKLPDILTFLDQKRDEIISCVTPGTKIVTSAGLVPVEEMRPGMRVLTHTGRWKPVTEILVNPTYAPVLEIKANGFDALQATANHPVWASSYTQDRSHGHHFDGHSWVPAGEIVPRVRNKRGASHALTLPGADLSGSTEILRCADHLQLGPRNTSLGFTSQRAWDDGEYIRHSSSRVFPIPSEIKMGYEFGRLLGLYLAEGHIINGSGVCWSFHEDETDYQNEVRSSLEKVFGLSNVSVKPVANGAKGVNVYVRNVFLAELFTCGKALTKRLPEWAWNGGAEFFKGVLSGWADGDGSLVVVNGKQGGPRQRVTTRSETLAWQMRIIAVTLGLPASFSVNALRDMTGREIAGRAVRTNGPAYEVSWPLDPQRGGSYRVEEGTLTSPVRTAERINYDGLVYNLEVEDDNSYVTTCGTVHNCYGVPPSKVSIIETGNIGGGSGEEQDITYKVDVCAPIGELILEAFNFAVTGQGFGIEDWHAKFREVDYRASSVIEGIRDQRLRNGSWVLNRYRAEIGEPPVEGGDDAVLVDRQNLVLWSDMSAMSKAMIAGKGAPAVAAGETPPGGEPMAPGATDGQSGPGAEDDAPQESLLRTQIARYRARVREALKATAISEAAGSGVTGKVYAQLAKAFPASALGWVKSAAWSGPEKVPLKDIDTDSRDDWDASHQPAKVSAFVSKLHKRQRAGRELKPAVLVKRPTGKLLVADGHHRFLAYEQDGQDYIWAYVGKVDSERGDWDVLALSQHKQGKAA